MSDEPVAVINLVELLEGEWNPDLEKPTILDVHSMRESRINLDTGDFILVSEDTRGETDTQHAHWEYRDVEIPMNMEIYTNQSLQRLHNIKAEIRRIIYKNKHSIEGFQSIRFNSFVETMSDTIGMWRGICKATISSMGLKAS